MSFRYISESDDVSKVYFNDLYVGTASKRDDGDYYAVVSGGRQLGPFNSLAKAFDAMAIFYVAKGWPHPMQGTPSEDGWYLVWVHNDSDWSMLELSSGEFDCKVDYWLPLPPKPGAVFKQ